MRCVTSIVPHFLDQFEPVLLFSAERFVTSSDPHLLDQLKPEALSPSDQRVGLVIALPTNNPKILVSYMLDGRFCKCFYHNHQRTTAGLLLLLLVAPTPKPNRHLYIVTENGICIDTTTRTPPNATQHHPTPSNTIQTSLNTTQHQPAPTSINQHQPTQHQPTPTNTNQQLIQTSKTTIP